jgi:hypothetical protein
MAERVGAASVARPLLIDRRRVEAHLLSLPTLAALALALTALLGLLYLAQTSSLAITGYDVQELEAERARWQLRNDQLRLQIAEARSLDTVEREARLRLRMGPPERVVFVQQPAVPAAKSLASPPSGLRAAVETIQRIANGVLGWLSGEF